MRNLYLRDAVEREGTTENPRDGVYRAVKTVAPGTSAVPHPPQIAGVALGGARIRGTTVVNAIKIGEGGPCLYGSVLAPAENTTAP